MVLYKWVLPIRAEGGTEMWAAKIGFKIDSAMCDAKIVLKMVQKCVLPK